MRHPAARFGAMRDFKARRTAGMQSSPLAQTASSQASLRSPKSSCATCEVVRWSAAAHRRDRPRVARHRDRRVLHRSSDPSGCGKTTLLRILAGLETPTSGERRIERSGDRTGPRNSMVFQGESIFPWMTVFDNAAYGLRMRRAPGGEIREIVGALPRQDRPEPLRRRVPAPALRRHEAAGLDRARVRQRPRDPADGRAVLGARRAEQEAAAGGAAADLGRAQEDGGVHHAQRRRGGDRSATASW